MTPPHTTISPRRALPTAFPLRIRLAVFALLLAAGPLAPVACAQGESLPTEQAQLSEKFARLETLAVRIAELVEIENPDRAEQLRSAIARSRDLALSQRFDAIVALLEQEQYSAASRNQTQLADNLDTLLSLLLADPREARLEAERRKLKQAIKQVGRVLREQRALRNDTIERTEPSDNSEQQEELSKETGRLAKELGAPNSDKPQDNQPQPGEPQPSDNNAQPQESSPQEPGPEESTPQEQAAKRLSQAQESMKKAAEKMRQADGKGAAGEQSKAERELEQAKEQLEEALRQTREEEITRTLTRLATRLRNMLGEETEIKRLTNELQDKHGDDMNRAKRSAAAGLSKRQDDVTRMATAAVRLLTEEGRSVAFVEVLTQARDDMQLVSQRLVQGNTGQTTQVIETDIIQALEESIAAVDSQLSEMANRQQDGAPQQQQEGEQQDPPLVDSLAELRMLRSLQNRILSRTRRYHLMAAGGEMSDEQLRESLARLAQRQRRAIEATHGLTGQ